MLDNRKQIQYVSRMKSKEEITSILRSMKYELASSYHVSSIGIFGSVARNESNELSDLDLLVEFDGLIGIFRFTELEDLLAKRLDCKIDLVSKKALKSAIGRSILQEVTAI